MFGFGSISGFPPFLQDINCRREEFRCRETLAMCQTTQSWDIDFLVGFLSPEEIDAIRGTLIEYLSKLDRLV